MGTQTGAHEIVERPQSIEHNAECKRIEGQMRDGIRRMVSTIEEAGGSPGLEELQGRMEEAGWGGRFFEIYVEASLGGRVSMDEEHVFRALEEPPAPTPEELARREAHLEAERRWAIRESGGKRIVMVGDLCPFTGEGLEAIRAQLGPGEAIVWSVEASRIKRLHLEGKATDAELEACLEEIARVAAEPYQEPQAAQWPPQNPVSA